MRIGSGSRWFFVLGLGLCPLLGPSPGEAADRTERVIVRVARPYDWFLTAVGNLGGTVTHQYANVDAVAASIPRERLAELLALQGVRVYRDTVVSIPRTPTGGPRNKLSGSASSEADGVAAGGAASVPGVAPADYLFNNSLIGATAVQAAGNYGDGVIVGVIDAGTANSPVVAALQPGTVIGGESFVTGAGEPGPTSRLNGPHGTWVGTVIAGNALFIVPKVSSGSQFFPRMVASLETHAPDSVFDCAAPPFNVPCNPATQALIPIVGVAPGAKIYALKVFPAVSDSTSDSIILAAMDRAITIRHNFNSGMPSVPVGGTGTEDDPFRYDSLKIDVVNMSLGGPTLFAGRDLEDELTRKMLAEGITLATSAGNDGFPAMTGGSPGTGFASLTVGAANTAPHERVLRDVQYGVGIGDLYRPSDAIQTAYFSSRGPTADGRLDPELTTPGFANFAQGTCRLDATTVSASCAAGSALAPFSIVSGTSFSSPTAAGAAALLRKGAPLATAAQIRNALSKGANPALLGDGSGRIDQGNGFLDVAKSLDLLLMGRVNGRLPTGLGSPSVVLNTASTGFKPILFVNDKYSAHVATLKPGQVKQVFVPVDDSTDQLTITVKNVTPEQAPAGQNQLFGDDLFVAVADAPTSFLRDRFFDFVGADTTIPVPNPQTGLVRLAIQGDWTNAGRISADLVIQRTRSPQGRPTAFGTVAEGEVKTIEFDVPSGTADLTVEAFWDKDWASYPTDDLDLYLFDPDGNLVVDATGAPPGATLDSPERTEVTSPPAGTWTALVAGFTVHDDGHGRPGHKCRRPNFLLRAKADGVRLRAN
ncbi:MAG TPA: S8 family serine peptidase [Vicinamibacteria bacterium]|nr:S8 family serine peptidase [Vicinamibacteria bacterium]